MGNSSGWEVGICSSMSMEQPTPTHLPQNSGAGGCMPSASLLLIRNKGSCFPQVSFIQRDACTRSWCPDPHCSPTCGSNQHCAEHQVHVCCSRDSLTEMFIVNVQIGSCCSKERVAAAFPALQIILPSEQSMQTSRSSAALTAAPAPCSALPCRYSTRATISCLCAWQCWTQACPALSSSQQVPDKRECNYLDRAGENSMFLLHPLQLPLAVRWSLYLASAQNCALARG